MRKNSQKRFAGFSLVELVVVIVIIGIIAAMAIPRMSRGSAGASDAALSGDLAVLRSALNLYAAEHNSAFPSGTGPEVATKLTGYTDSTGAAWTSGHKYGPYVAAIPVCPVGGMSSPTAILISTASPPTVVETNGEGWVYNVTTGEILANTNSSDAAGTDYKTY